MSAIVSKLFSPRWAKFFTAIAISVALRLAWKRGRKQVIQNGYPNRKEELDKSIESARDDRAASIIWARTHAANIDSAEFKCIFPMTFNELQVALQSGEISAESVMRAQISSALLANNHTNCIVRFLETSIDEAQKLDELARSPDYKKPPLFGMPLSVKEAVAVKNARCSFGVSTLLNQRCVDDSYTIERLREAGMVPFCQTNVSTYCMTYNCVNAIYGRTTHPRAGSRTSGGSSGGEAAAIGAHGSRAGIGADIGGSIRVPAAYAGVCGFKPSSSRMSLLQSPEPVPCRPFLVPTEGPFAESPQAIVEMMRVLWSNQFFSKRDAFAVPLDFQEDLFASQDGLRIGYFLSDGYIDPLPCMSRAVEEAAKALESRGYEMVPFSMDDIPREIYLGVAGTVFVDGGAIVSEDVKEETLTPMQEAIRLFGWKTRWEKKLLTWQCRWRGEKRFAELLEAMPQTAIEVQRGIDRIYGCRKRLHLTMKEQKIDALLFVPTYSPATTHEFPENDVLLSVLWNGILNTMWNALDVPVGVVPFEQVTEADMEILNKHRTNGTLERALQKDCKDSIGLPLAVQFVAPPFRDEIVLRLMCDLNEMSSINK